MPSVRKRPSSGERLHVVVKAIRSHRALARVVASRLEALGVRVTVKMARRSRFEECTLEVPPGPLAAHPIAWRNQRW